MCRTTPLVIRWCRGLRVTGSGWMTLRLRGDLHVHSTCSDGKASPQEILARILELGFEVATITDHDTFEGSLRLARLARSAGYELVVLIGAEIRTDAGDVLVYCAEKPLSRTPRVLEELIDHAHEEGCLAVAAHPFDRRRHGVGDRVYTAGFDAIEVFNAAADPLANRRAAEAARRLGKPGLANSDAHVLDFIGASHNVILADDATPEAVLRAIREGRVAPVPGRPGPVAYAKAVAWGLERRLRRRRGGPSRLDYLEDYQDYTPV